jgi:hypothetical protein
MKRTSIILISSALTLLSGLILAVHESDYLSLKAQWLTAYKDLGQAREHYGKYTSDFERFQAALTSLRAKVSGTEVSLVTIPNDFISRFEWFISQNYLTNQLIETKPLAIHGLRIFNGLQMGAVRKLSFAAHVESCRNPPIQRVELCLVQNGTLARCNRIELNQPYDKVCLETIE